MNMTDKPTTWAQQCERERLQLQTELAAQRPVIEAAERLVAGSRPHGMQELAKALRDYQAKGLT